MPPLCLAITLLVFLSSALAQHPSFDCAKASNPREHTICKFPELSAADAKLATAYTRELARLSPASAQLIRADQREWLDWLDLTCMALKPPLVDQTAPNCLQHEYATRLTQLQPTPSHPGAPSFYTRAHFTVVPGTSGDHDSEQDPGYGTGTFEWPQIDNPTPAQTTWNHAIYNAVLGVTPNPTPEHEKKLTNLDQGADASGCVWLRTGVLAVNQHLITTEIIAMTYSYGAAHPNTGVTYFSWWLEAGQALKPEDIFRSGADLTTLLPKIYAKLKANPDWGPYLWNNSNFPPVQEAIAKKFNNPLAWEITRTGLTLHFGQYEIGPYSIGVPETTIPWSELKPYLAPTFNPSNLPTLP